METDLQQQKSMNISHMFVKCSTCNAVAGQPCNFRGSTKTGQYHTSRQDASARMRRQAKDSFYRYDPLSREL